MARHTARHGLPTDLPDILNVLVAYGSEPRGVWMFSPVAGRPPNHVPRDQVFLSTLGSNRSSVGCGLCAVPDSALNVGVLIETAYRNHGIAWCTRMQFSKVVRALDYPPPFFWLLIIGKIHGAPTAYKTDKTYRGLAPWG